MADIRALPENVDALGVIADAWIEDAGVSGVDISEGIIFVPSRRAARALSAAFLRSSGNTAVVLPKIVPLNALDETALFFSAGLALPAAMPDARRLAVLATLILRWEGRSGAPETVGGALRLARDLAALMDEAARWEVDLHLALPSIVEGDLAEHWRNTVQFLSIVTEALPAILAEEGLTTSENRRLLLMDAQVQQWTLQPPSTRVWLVGVAYATPPLARFVGAIAALPMGRLYLSGYDAGYPETAWAELEAGSVSPYLGLKRLLQGIGCTREDVVGRPIETPRGAFVRNAFLPAAMLADWQDVTPAPDGVLMLSSQDEFEEARAIAAAIRDAVDQPGHRVALATPDRVQAARVAAELRRLGIEVEDSAGLLLGETPPAVFLRLIADAFSSGFSAVPLISLMSHPFFSPVEGRETSRRLARSLELEIIRPLSPEAGLDALAACCAGRRNALLEGFVAALQEAFAPLLALSAEGKFAIHDLFSRLLEVADTLSGGGEELWSGDAGGLLGNVLMEFVDASQALPDMPASELGDVLLAALQDARLRRPRSKDAHPRVAIWGVLEARLQSVDTLFVGGLTEGVFPAAADPGPWFSRAMRRTVGLPSPEDAIAEAAHDFVSMVQYSGLVVLCVPKRTAGAPAVPSRFVARLDALAEGRGVNIPRHPASQWVRVVDTPTVRDARPRPAPMPPVEARPSSYSVTDITTLMNDPYALYAKRVLKIRDVKPLSEDADPALFGTIVHDGIAAYMTGDPDLRAPGAADALYGCMVAAFPTGRPSVAVKAWWLARLKRLAAWVVSEECERLAGRGLPVAAKYEVAGSWEIDGGRFTVKARADRLEARVDEMGNRQISVIDYKTGTPPSSASVMSGGVPQLVIEAAMAGMGCFGDEFYGPTRELAYWHLTGGATEGKVANLFSKRPETISELTEKASSQIPELLRHFAQADVPYLDRPHPGRTAARGQYAGISRRAEWDANV